jgi:asparagine synthase (glutamine-hydrolysing)
MGLQFRIECNIVGAELKIASPEQGTGLFHLTRTSRYLAVLFGRLYYIPDQLKTDRRGIDGRVSRELSNAITLYEAGGISALTALEGDFSLLLWDRARRLLIAQRDPFGGYPVYWMRTPGGAVFSNSLLALAGEQESWEFNREFLSRYLTASAPIMEELNCETTAYKGVCRLKAGHLLTFSPSESILRTQCYWDWNEKITVPQSSTIEGASEEYCATLGVAVKQRAIGTTFSHLSGGIDSTAVSLLAAAAKKPEPVSALSLIFVDTPSLRKEPAYIDKVTRAAANIIPHAIAADAMRPFHGAVTHEEPWPAQLWSETEAMMLSVAMAGNADTVLTGIGADEVVSVEPYHLADALRAGRLLEMWREAGQWAEEFSSSRWDLILKYAVQPALAHGRFPGGEGLPWPFWHRSSRSKNRPPWIRPEFVAEHGGDHMHYEARKRPYEATSTRVANAIFGFNCRRGDIARWSVWAPAGIHVAHPFQDCRLVSLGLGAMTKYPVELTRLKPLVTHALDLLPPALVARRDTCVFDELYVSCFSRVYDRFRRTLDQAEIRDLGIFDPAELNNALHRAALGLTDDARSLGQLDLTLSALVWIEAQVKQPPRAPEYVVSLALKNRSEK